ncbi:TPA: DUF551 domain-containing protein [Escherichia coli]|nr:DUF551 domain-containing protein [Escherichia coli]
MGKWIKCSERMPAPFSHVLVTDGDEVEIKWLDGDFDEWDSWEEFNSNIDNGDIAHWRKVPKPPKLV